jgi:FlaG/FlaF family flagellin (archaellin)
MKKSMMAAAAQHALPPPSSKGSRKTLVIAVIVIVAIAAVAVGVYLATRSGGGGANVAGASSLQFTSSVTTGTAQGTYTYYAKNVGASNTMLRIEYTDPSGAYFVYILDGAQQKAWVQSGGEWTDLSSTYASQWSHFNSGFTNFKNSLAAGWPGVGDWTYTTPEGITGRIYNITVNPSLADSLFQPPS